VLVDGIVGCERIRFTDPDSPDTLSWTTPTGRVYSTEPRPPLEPG
jgi:hypothetical protein